ncbi:hypothetical protein Micbo1qcDRAFT_165095, partial [Microdochium bolleyi]
MHARNPSSKGLHKHTSASSTKLASKQHRRHSPSPDRSATHHAAISAAALAAVAASVAPTSSTANAAAAASAHRRSTSDVKLSSRDSSSANLRKNASHSSLVGKRNRSHVEIAKKSKSAANIKRSASHRDVNKVRGARGSKGSVHFALGDNDGDEDDEDGDEDQEDEWVDASGSASPYLSRRGSVASGVPSPSKPRDDPSQSTPSSRPHTPKEPSHLQQQHRQDEEEQEEQKQKEPAQPGSSSDSASDRETIQHKEYLTSRLLKRTPSYSAPHTTKETATVQPRGSPDSVRASLYGTPKNSTAIVGSDQTGEVTSRFVNGPGVGAEPGSFYTPTRSPAQKRSVDLRRPQSASNRAEEHRDSISSTAAATVSTPTPGVEHDSALARGARRSAARGGGAPADTSRTQQKLNLQRASSS